MRLFPESCTIIACKRVCSLYAIWSGLKLWWCLCEELRQNYLWAISAELCSLTGSTCHINSSILRHKICWINEVATNCIRRLRGPKTPCASSAFRSKPLLLLLHPLSNFSFFLIRVSPIHQLNTNGQRLYCRILKVVVVVLLQHKQQLTLNKITLYFQGGIII